MPPVNGWILIEKQPPPGSTEVLVWTDRLGCCIGSYSIVNKDWFANDGEQIIDPTHWQPLPKGPRDTRDYPADAADNAE